MNPSKGTEEVDLRLPGGGEAKILAAYETSKTHDLKAVSRAGKHSKYSFPPESVTTLLIQEPEHRP